MTMFVPYLSVEQIERDADALLAEFAQARGIVMALPIPIEDIIEKHLKLHVEFDDLQRLLGVPRGPDGEADIFGAMVFKECRIVLDESLDPEEDPRRENLYLSTLAHEGCGHWRLHRHLFKTDATSLFDAPSVVCRTTQRKERCEWQAQFHASCTQMPRNLVIGAWHERFGNTKPLVLRNKFALPASLGDDIVQAFNSFREGSENWDFENYALYFAKKFKVSVIAMRIRLEQIGLLQREVPRQRWSKVAS
jgi:hypothetical protein